MKPVIILITAFQLFCGTADFSVKLIYIKPDAEIRLKINNFASTLEKQLDNYNWKFPHDDFDKIETNISVNIEKSTADKTFTGIINISSGIASPSVQAIALKKDIYFNEQDIVFTIDYESDPNLDKMDPGSIETLVLFYINLVLGENFDRLSYTDQKNFRLEGDRYFQKLYEFENILTSATERISWNKRLEIINNYRQNTNADIRKLNAFIYNAVYFINSGKKDRARFFVEPIHEIISKTPEYPINFFANNFYALGEIFSLEHDIKYLKLLIEKDPEHESTYSQKLPKQPTREKPKINE